MWLTNQLNASGVLVAMFYVVAMVASNMNGLLVLGRKTSIWRFNILYKFSDTSLPLVCLPLPKRVGCGTPCLSWSLGVREVVGSRPGRGNIVNIVRRVFHPTRKLVWFSLLKCPSIPNSKFVTT